MKRNVVLKSAWCMLLFFIVLSGYSQTSKTRAFQDYQLGRNFKGIKFGSSIGAVDSKVRLKEYLLGIYEMTNTDYLLYNNIQFHEGVIYFNRDERMYKVALYYKINGAGINDYNKIKNSFLSLFGKNDSEYYINDRTSMNITWEGENTNIYIRFSPGDDRIGIVIQDKKVPETDPIRRDVSGIPKI